MSTVFMFSGQGSQYYQMGQDLYQQEPAFRDYFEHLDSLIRRIAGISVIENLYHSNKSIAEPLDDLVLSSLAICMLQLATVKMLRDKGVEPDKLLSSSFGTFVAMVVANCIDEEEALGIFYEHGCVFRRHSEPGAMLVVLSAEDLYYGNAFLSSQSELAGVNFDSSFVISFPEKNTAEIKNTLKSLGCAYQLMPIPRAFHSPWIDDAKKAFFNLYSALSFREPSIPITCTSGQDIDAGLNAQMLWQAVRGPMNFDKTVRELEKCGPHQYIDVGSAGTLATFLKYILPSDGLSEGFPINTPYGRGIENLDRITFKVRS